MTKKLNILTLVIALAGSAAAQSISSSTAHHIGWGTALPATCSPTTGDVFFKTASVIGTYQCLTTNTWTAMGGGGGGGTVSSATATDVAFYTGATTVGGNANLIFDPAQLTRGRFQVGLLNTNASYDGNIQGWWGLTGTANVGTITTTGASSALVVQQQGAGSFIQGISLMAFGTDNTVEGAAVDAINLDAGFNSAIDDNTRVIRGLDMAVGNAGSGIVGTAVAISVAGNPFCSTCPTVDRAAIHIFSQGQNSGVTRGYGIWIEDQVNAGTNYAIKAGTGIVEFDQLKTTGSATGKKVVCVDTATGILYASTSDTQCLN